MSSPEINPQLSQEYQMTPPTEVLDSLEGMDKFFSKVESFIGSHPNEMTVVSLVGESGSGKSTVAGQIIEKLKNSKKLSEKLQDADVINDDGIVMGKGKELKLIYFSLAMSLEMLQKKGVLRTPGWGGFTPEEYAQNSEVMADLISLAKHQLLRDKKITPVFILDTVAVTDPIDRGTFAVIDQDRENQFVIALETDEEVQKRAVLTREKFWESNDPDLFIESLKQNKIVWDKEMSERDLEELKKSAGNRVAITRNRNDVNVGMVRAKDRFGEGYDFTIEDLENDLEKRHKLLSLYYEYLLKDKWKIQKGHYLVTRNTFIGDQSIHVYYKSVAQDHSLRVEELLKGRISVLNRVAESPDRVD